MQCSAWLERNLGMSDTATGKSLSQAAVAARGPASAVMNSDTRRERLSDDLMDAIAQGVCLVDRNFVVRPVNRRFMEMFDMPAEFASPGRHFGDYIRHSLMRWTDDEDEIERRVAAVLADF